MSKVPGHCSSDDKESGHIKKEVGERDENEGDDEIVDDSCVML